MQSSIIIAIKTLISDKLQLINYNMDSVGELITEDTVWTYILSQIWIYDYIFISDSSIQLEIESRYVSNLFLQVFPHIYVGNS